MLNRFIMLLVAATILAGCQNNDEPIPQNPLADMVNIHTENIDNEAYKIDVYMVENPFVGFNRIYLQVTDLSTNSLVNDFVFGLAPLMSMDGGAMTHACPVEEPIYNNDLFAAEGAIIFIMPTAMMNTWELTISYSNEIATGNFSFPVTVTNPEMKRLTSFVSDLDQKSYFITLIDPTQPHVGENSLELGIYQKESMMSFPAIDDLGVGINVTMPSMGHGSPGNIAPTSQGKGHYLGQVNFTMSGMWQVDFTITDSSSNLLSDSQYFQIEF